MLTRLVFPDEPYYIINSILKKYKQTLFRRSQEARTKEQLVNDVAKKLRTTLLYFWSLPFISDCDFELVRGSCRVQCARRVDNITRKLGLCTTVVRRPCTGCAWVREDVTTSCQLQGESQELIQIGCKQSKPICEDFAHAK